MTQYAIKQEHLDRASLIVSKMSLSQKASLCSGRDFWHTKPLEELSVPSIMMTDGPHGLRKQKDESDHLGINESYPATCFPPAAASACSFDRELM
ncbi:MAG: glycosyl hydrolase, partial [Clostridiaceae bacterium]|nr:glycosyl hydrolase [Clostridiaceae bacterium]